MQPQQQWPGQPAPQQQAMTWAQPEPVQQFAWDMFANQTVIWIQGGYHAAIQTSYGAKPAARGTLIVLTGQYAGQIHDNRLIFGQKMLSQVQGYPQGHVMLARLIMDAGGKSVVFDRFGDYDAQVASHWASSNPGVMENLRTLAVANFAEESNKPQTGPVAGGPAPAAAPQWTPPPGNGQAQVGTMASAAPQMQTPLVQAFAHNHSAQPAQPVMAAPPVESYAPQAAPPMPATPPGPYAQPNGAPPVPAEAQAAPGDLPPF